MQILTRFGWVLGCSLTTLAMTGCVGADAPDDPVDEIDACFTCSQGRADHLEPGPYQTAGVLELVNTASRRELDDDAALDVRAANNIVDARVDDGPFEDLERLDAVPYVGPYALHQLLTHAEAVGYVGACGDSNVVEAVETCDDGNIEPGDGCSELCQVEPGVEVHGIAEGSPDAQAILDVANTATFRQLDDDARLDRRGAQNIVAERPFGSLTQLDRVPYVAATAFDRLLEYSATRRQCGDGAVDQLIADINATEWGASSTREIRTDMALGEALDSDNWPAELTHAGCFGVRPDDVPSWIPVTDPEDNQRLLTLFDVFAEQAERRGDSIEDNDAIEQLMCRTESLTFVGCRLAFQPDPSSGITWNIIASEDETITYLFVGTWAE